MKISELIKKLENEKDRYGDIEVQVCDGYDCFKDFTVKTEYNTLSEKFETKMHQ